MQIKFNYKFQKSLPTKYDFILFSNDFANYC